MSSTPSSSANNSPRAAPPPPRPPNNVDGILRELGVTRSQAYAIGASALACGILLNNSTKAGNAFSIGVLGLAGSLFLLPAPTEASFTGFFKSWFLDRYMAAAGKSYRDYLKQKSKREDGLQAIGTKITRWFHKATEDVNNTLFYELSVKHALPNAYRVNVMEVFRFTQVNLGSPRKPAWFTFIGAYRMWFWIPVIWTDGGLVFDLTLAVADGGLLNYDLAG
ncbi:unnamed protein product [Amoebophrya sp. A120]|nr:unnamed protein product [Amoebophrya sp. A120]|eukprot:GSA120T00006935001.1